MGIFDSDDRVDNGLVGGLLTFEEYFNNLAAAIEKTNTIVGISDSELAEALENIKIVIDFLKKPIFGEKMFCFIQYLEQYRTVWLNFDFSRKLNTKNKGF